MDATLDLEQLAAITRHLEAHHTQRLEEAKRDKPRDYWFHGYLTGRAKSYREVAEAAERVLVGYTSSGGEVDDRA